LTVLILATTTGYQIRSFGEAAEALGVRLLFGSDRCDQLDDPWWDGAIPIRFHEPRRSADAIASAAGARDLRGVIAVGDRPTLIAALVAERLRLPGNPPAAAMASRNKVTTRHALRQAGLRTPAFLSIPKTADIERLAPRIAFPSVVKPLALSGSRGVVRVDNAAELRAAVERLNAILEAPDVRAERDAAHDMIVIESFIPGREYAVEGLLTDGRFRPLAIFDKPDPLDGPFFEETIYVTPSRASDATQAHIIDAIARAADALGLRHGPVHAECRVNDEGVWVLEVAARPIGGLCSKALRFAGPPCISLEELLLRHAIGEDVSAFAREAEASAVMMIPIPRRGLYRGVDGLDAARAVPGVDDIRITAKPEAVVVPLPEGRSYLGFIFAHACDAADAERAVREAHVRLHFQIDRELPVI